MSFELTLYLGAHKTGTTYVQDRLRINKEFIFDTLGIKYIDLPTTRRRFMPLFYKTLSSEFDVEFSKKQMELELSSQLAGDEAKRIIFSDENLLGSPREITGTPYSSSQKRLSCFNSITSHFVIKDIYICIRAYDEFLQSLYIESIKSKSYIPLGKLKKDKLLNFSWISLLDVISKNFPKSNLYVVKYEEFKVDNSILFNSLLEAEMFDQLKDIKKSRVSPDAAVLSLLDKVHKLELAPNEMNFVSKHLLKANEKIFLNDEKKNYLFTENELAILHGNYLSDLDIIKQRFDVI